MNGKEIAAKLREALALMNDQGAHWIKGASAWPTRQGPANSDLRYQRFCSIGAIRYLTSGDPWTANDDTYAVAAALSKKIRPDSNPIMREYGPLDKIVSWNDDYRRSWEDVVAAFEQAADEAEANA